MLHACIVHKVADGVAETLRVQPGYPSPTNQHAGPRLCYQKYLRDVVRVPAVLGAITSCQRTTQSLARRQLKKRYAANKPRTKVLCMLHPPNKAFTYAQIRQPQN
jgi:hypothetical protein